MDNVDVWGEIVEFVGPGYYRLIAAVNHRCLWDTYKDRFGCQTWTKVAYCSKELAEQMFLECNDLKDPFCSKIRRLAFKTAASFGKIEVLDWLWLHRSDLGLDCGLCGLGVSFPPGCWPPSEHDHLEVLKWAREHEGCLSWSTSICSDAAVTGHLEVLQWARENDCRWRFLTCGYAAQNGHLEVLQWARENGCPWDSRTCEYAAKNGHLEVLEWAIDRGGEWAGEADEYYPQHVRNWILERNAT